MEEGREEGRREGGREGRREGGREGEREGGSILNSHLPAFPTRQNFVEINDAQLHVGLVKFRPEYNL